MFLKEYVWVKYISVSVGNMSMLQLHGGLGEKLDSFDYLMLNSDKNAILPN